MSTYLTTWHDLELQQTSGDVYAACAEAEAWHDRLCDDGELRTEYRWELIRSDQGKRDALALYADNRRTGIWVVAA